MNSYTTMLAVCVAVLVVLQCGSGEPRKKSETFQYHGGNNPYYGNYHGGNGHEYYGGGSELAGGHYGPHGPINHGDGGYHHGNAIHHGNGGGGIYHHSSQHGSSHHGHGSHGGFHHSDKAKIALDTSTPISRTARTSCPAAAPTGDNGAQFFRCERGFFRFVSRSAPAVFAFRRRFSPLAPSPPVPRTPTSYETRPRRPALVPLSPDSGTRRDRGAPRSSSPAVRRRPRVKNGSRTPVRRVFREFSFLLRQSSADGIIGVPKDGRARRADYQQTDETKYDFNGITLLITSLFSELFSLEINNMNNQIFQPGLIKEENDKLNIPIIELPLNSDELCTNSRNNKVPPLKIVKKEEGDKLEYVINNSNIESEEVEFCKKLDHDQLSSSQNFENVEIKIEADVINRLITIYDNDETTEPSKNNLSNRAVLQCGICKVSFSKNSDLSSHMMIHFGKRSFKCVHCNMILDSQYNLVQHKKFQCDNKPFQCDMCKKKFFNKSSIFRHITDTHFAGEKIYSCTICKKSFSNQQRLKDHSVLHSDKKPYKCTMCEKSFPRRHILTRHVLIHNTDKPYQCSVCEKSFIHQYKLTRHVLIHSTENPYQCTVCEKTFPSKYTLTRHALLHLGEKPYQCTFCLQLFPKKYMLTSHTLIHRPSKPYQCTVCDKSFPNKFNLTRHTLTHSVERPYQCENCEKSFSIKSNLDYHVSAHHTDRRLKTICKICKKSFACKSSLNRHLIVAHGE